MTPPTCAKGTNAAVTTVKVSNRPKNDQTSSSSDSEPVRAARWYRRQEPEESDFQTRDRDMQDCGPRCAPFNVKNPCQRDLITDLSIDQSLTRKMLQKLSCPFVTRLTRQLHIADQMPKNAIRLHAEITTCFYFNTYITRIHLQYWAMQARCAA